MLAGMGPRILYHIQISWQPVSDHRYRKVWGLLWRSWGITLYHRRCRYFGQSFRAQTRRENGLQSMSHLGSEFGAMRNIALDAGVMNGYSYPVSWGWLLSILHEIPWDTYLSTSIMTHTCFILCGGKVGVPWWRSYAGKPLWAGGRGGDSQR